MDFIMNLLFLAGAVVVIRHLLRISEHLGDLSVRAENTQKFVIASQESVHSIDQEVSRVGRVLYYRFRD